MVWRPFPLHRWAHQGALSRAKAGRCNHTHMRAAGSQASWKMVSALQCKQGSAHALTSWGLQLWGYSSDTPVWSSQRHQQLWPRYCHAQWQARHGILLPWTRHCNCIHGCGAAEPTVRHGQAARGRSLRQGAVRWCQHLEHMHVPGGSTGYRCQGHGGLIVCKIASLWRTANRLKWVCPAGPGTRASACSG